MFGQLITIARNTFVEAVRQPVYFLLVVICGILMILTTWGTGFTVSYSGTAEVSADNKLLLEIGLATIFVCSMLMAAFVATAVVSREIENRTVLTVVSKPVARPVLIIGKYLGVAAAMSIATFTMVLFLLLAIRHGVLTTAADFVDQPVIVFTGIAVFAALGLATWCNFFYGWVFSQTATLLLAPFTLIAFLLVLSVSKEWQPQSPLTDFKGQITLVSMVMVAAQLVLTAIATACSTRLGQVMTIVVCAGVFVLGLLSNHMFGRHIYENDIMGKVVSAEPVFTSAEGLQRPGDEYELVLETPPPNKWRAGSSAYFGPNPNGSGLITPAFEPFSGNVADEQELAASTPALVVMDVNNKTVRIRHAGRTGLGISRPPQAADFMFAQPTETNIPMMVVWGLTPNVQAFWLVDAVTRNQDVPTSHVILIGLYTVAQIMVFLSIATILFQDREVG